MNLAKRAIRTVPAIRRVYDERDGLRRELKALKALRARDEEEKKALAAPDHKRPDSFPIPKFWERNYWEATVQLALRDYCRPGDTVFDVGANAGALALVMSRLVGPRGIVCAFEASPRIVDKTLHNLVTGGCANVTVYHRAVFRTSGEILTLYPGTHLNDSLYVDHGALGGQRFEVTTLALDDFVAATGLVPKLVKMDIEGAEQDALLGAGQLLERHRPVLILEQSPEDMRCHAHLTALGYRAVDLATYRPIEGARDFEPGAGVANVLFVHEATAAADDPYLAGAVPVAVETFPRAAFTADARGGLTLARPLALGPGRYACVADFSATGADNEIFAGIEDRQGELQRYHTNTALMAQSYRRWLFQLDRPAEVRTYLRFLVGQDPSLDWRGAAFWRYPAFDRQAPAVVA